MHLAILYDGHSLAEWQRRAIALIAEDHRLSYLVHETPGSQNRNLLKHLFYYVLNLFTIRNRLNRAAPMPLPLDANIKRFMPLEDGMWSALPADVLDWLRQERVDAVIKFGLSLLRIPDQAPPILSYHHGDPRAYRGRPAGLYEVLNGEPFVGQIVQVLSNKLDAGAVLAFTETRVHSHSYRKTLLEAYGVSPRLLPRALAALAAGETLPLKPTGRNYRLPGNATVLRLVAGCAWNFANRLLYGAFVEKRWSVSTIALPPDSCLAGLGEAIENVRESWATLPLLAGYTFNADPFFHTGPSDILVEAMNAKTGKGELVRFVDGAQRRIACPPGAHTSYPQTIEQDGVLYVVPETADWSPPAVFAIEGDALRLVQLLDIDVASLIDPTLFRLAGHIYLFGNRDDGDPGALHLWVATGLFDRFELHPASPIFVGSRGSRMAGEISMDGEQPVRLGQDCRKGYGDGVVCFRIDHLDPAHYRETFLSALSFTGVSGPHTLNRRGGTFLFDWYVERKSPLAGVRRLLNRL